MHQLKTFTFLKTLFAASGHFSGFADRCIVIDLSIPRLIQRIIDMGVNRNDMQVVLQTSAIMVGLSILQFVLALGTISSPSVWRGDSRDLREALFVKNPIVFLREHRSFHHRALEVRLSSDTGACSVSFRFHSYWTRAPLLMIGSLILMFNTENRSLACQCSPAAGNVP